MCPCSHFVILRVYRIFWKQAVYDWQGPPLRQLLKLVAPHQTLDLFATDMYWMEDSDLVPS